MIGTPSSARSFDLHEEAVEWIRSWWRAWAEKDLKALGAMVAPGYSERTATRRFRTVALEELMAEASRCCDVVSIASWEVFDPVTKLYENVAVCSYSFRLSGKRGGRSFALSGRATDVLKRRGQSFLLVSHEGVIDVTSTGT